MRQIKGACLSPPRLVDCIALSAAGEPAWEATSKANAEYLRYYSIPEMQTPLETELAKFLPDAELTQILATRSKATQILGLQSRAIKNFSPAR